MRTKKSGHIHGFGFTCLICLKNNPDKHQEKQRKSYSLRIKKVQGIQRKPFSLRIKKVQGIQKHK